MRIALLCPYSWTYPGGVTRHIEALAKELIACDHEVKVLSPFDPHDALSKHLHRGARPEPRQAPPYLVSLGRTLGIEANGAVSNISLFPEAVKTMRKELREGGYDVLHIHEPVVPIVSWDALCSTEKVPLVGTFHTYSDNALTNGAARFAGAARRMNRLHARIAVSEAACWTARRFFGGRYSIVPNGVHLRDRLTAGEGDAGGGLGGDGLGGGGLGGCELGGDGLGGCELGGDGLGGGGLGGCELGGLAPADDRSGFAWHALADVGSGLALHVSGAQRPLRILFIGQAVERKGLPVLLKAFEALREHVPSTLTLVGAGPDQVAPLLLDDRGVKALGKVSEAEKAAALEQADVLCAPSLHGESFGMVLTEAFATSTPVIASDITGYRDVVRDGRDGLLVPPGDPIALAEALRMLALSPQRHAAMASAARERAERFAWPQVAAEVLQTYERAIAVASPEGRRQSIAVRMGIAPADLLPRVPPQRLKSLEPAPRRSLTRRVAGLGYELALAAAGLALVTLTLLIFERIGIAKVITSIVSSKPGLIVAGLGLMCAAMVLRGLAWHGILSAASTWRPARRRDALQGTFIGVLMSATLPVRLGETSRALIVARRIGRARETLPIVLGSIVSQTLLNLIALSILGLVSVLSVDLLPGVGILLALGLLPAGALLIALLAPVLASTRTDRDPRGRAERLTDAMRVIMRRLGDGLALFRKPRAAAIATAAQLVAWAMQLLACWLLLMALGLDRETGFGAAAAVLFAVNATSFVPLTPANVGVFQAACAAVLAGAYHVSGPDALAYGIVLQAVELAAATAMGLPALVGEGISWRELRLRTTHASPVRIRPLPQTGAQLEASSTGTS